MSNAFEFLRYETQEHLAHITLNRPEILNAFHPPMWAELTLAMEAFRDDPDLWVAILTGTGDRAFSVGADLKWRAAHEDAARTTSPLGERPRFISPDFTCWKPVIAAVNGYAIGGGLELALACDIIVAAEHAQFGFPEARRGLMADAGGVHRLLRHVPLKVAMGLLLTGTFIPATEAYRIGLVNEVVPRDELMAAATRWAGEILACSPLAVQAAKQAASQGMGWPLEIAMTRTYSLHQRLRQSEDFAKGPRAFAEKRRPVWKGR
jgi:enoyl-CoA hydratase/carnithine racemase